MREEILQTQNKSLRPSLSLILWDKLWNKQSEEWTLSVMNGMHQFTITRAQKRLSPLGH